MAAYEVYVYRNQRGIAPFERRLDRLGVVAAVKIAAALAQLEAGNFSDSRHVGGGVRERRIHSGPGYRLYYAVTNDAVIVLTAGTKSTQHSDIHAARTLWNEYFTTKK